MQIRELNSVLAEKAQNELSEEPNRIEKDIQMVKDWLEKQPHLHARTDDQWLVGFLRGCKYSLERTKEKLDIYYTIRSAIPDYALPVDPLDPWVQEILSLGVAVPLPKTANPSDPRVVIVRPGCYDADKIATINTMRVSNMFSSIYIMDDDQSVISGQIYIIDLANVTMSHFTQMTPSLIKKMVMSGQDALPFRQKGTHHINSPPGAEIIFNIFKKFMNEKARNRIYLHGGNMESLHEVIPKAILPQEYGGDAGPIQDIIDQWKGKVESYRDWFFDDRQYKSDESKRIGTPKTAESLFGIEGSFRQLNVD